jgi:hypothetical protein
MVGQEAGTKYGGFGVPQHVYSRLHLRGICIILMSYYTYVNSVKFLHFKVDSVPSVINIHFKKYTLRIQKYPISQTFTQ